MIGEADYRSVISAVRTPRLAILIDETTSYWQIGLASLTRIFSQAWGGKYFLIVPTDGKRIKEEFWEILEAYSPDYLGTYQMTLADLQEADPGAYRAQVDHWQRNWPYERDFDEWLTNQRYLTSIGTFEIDDSLTQELVNRLAPMHLGKTQLALRQRLIRDHDLSFPFTKVTDINPNAQRPVESLLLPNQIEDPDLRALILSLTGDLTQSAMEAYSQQGVTIASLTSDYLAEHLIESAIEGSTDPIKLRLKKDWIRQKEASDPAADNNLVRYTPFQASMLHLIRYYRTDMHHDWEESSTLVIGDTIDDFCLYYCLSRLHDGVFWLPQKWLREHERRRVNNRRLQRKGRPRLPYPQCARVAAEIVELAHKSIRYGQSKKRIEFRSMSLTKNDLQGSARLIDRTLWAGLDKFSAHVCITELRPPSACIGRVMEENNYTNQQEMVFIGGTSVGRVLTPKPKNFKVIDPMNHRWITSLQISEYSPPSLAQLDGRIALTHESRAASDGIAYFCPAIAYFGGDIDSILTRPQLQIMTTEDTIRRYFTAAGLEIRPSDKGNYLTDTIARFGGLEAAAKFISQADTRAVLGLFTRDESAKDDSVVFLRPEGGRAFVSYTGVQQCVGDGATEIIDELVAKDILRRGMIFLCLRCRLSSWYDLSTITTEFMCRRCDLRQQFTKANWKSPEEPRWYYALAETVYQCYTHNSYLTILTLDFLRRRAKSSFSYLPEIDVINFPEKDENIEIDIACVLDGRIILGECKLEALKPSHVMKYEALATALGRRPDELLFSTAKSKVSDSFKLRIDGLAIASFLTSGDLMS